MVHVCVLVAGLWYFISVGVSRCTGSDYASGRGSCVIVVLGKKEDETGRGTHGNVLIVEVVAGTVKLARYCVSVVLAKTWLDLWHGICAIVLS